MWFLEVTLAWCTSVQPNKQLLGTYCALGACEGPQGKPKNPGPCSEGILWTQGGYGRCVGDSKKLGRSRVSGVVGDVREQCWDRMKDREGAVRGQKGKVHSNHRRSPFGVQGSNLLNRVAACSDGNDKR